MDINEHISYIATELLNNLQTSLTKELHDQISTEVLKKAASVELDSIVTSVVTKHLERYILNNNFAATSNAEITRILNATTSHINNVLVDVAKEKIKTDIEQSLSILDLRQLVSNITETHLSALVTNLKFPSSSIPHSAINFSGIQMTGDMIKSGIISKFSSTGIEDRASTIQLTIMDNSSVFEGTIYSPEIQVKGAGLIEGDLTVNGKLNIIGGISEDSDAFQTLIRSSASQTHDLLTQTLNTEWFTRYSNIVFAQIEEKGLDLNKITQHGKEIITGNQLGYHITDSNLQRVGFLNDLQTRGETLLSDTLYTTGKRVGINTLDPSATFVVWDEECEIIVSKRKLDTGYIGTTRNQQLIVGSNNKDNLVLNTDGSVVVDKLTIGKVSVSSTNECPSHAADRGQILFNDNPDIGLPIGWVSLGGARWAPFGIIGE